MLAFQLNYLRRNFSLNLIIDQPQLTFSSNFSDSANLERASRGRGRTDQGGRGQQEKDPSEETRREFESRPSILYYRLTH